MQALIITIHILVCLALIAVVLLQKGKGADMGAAFGGASQTLFGSSGGATLLSKLTSAAAVVFMVTSLSLSYRAANRYKTSVMPDSVTTGAPAVEAPAAPVNEPAPAALPAEPQPAKE